MDQTDVTYYLISETTPAVDAQEKILKSCEALDFSGTNEKTFYNGLEGFDSETTYEFEIKPEEALQKAEEHQHNNFTLLEWQNDELLTETAETLEEITEKSQLTVDAISLLTGPHEILSFEDNTIISAEFSLAFYFETPLLEDAADLNLKTRKNKAMQEKIEILEQICDCTFKGIFGGS
jgi:hypothetical protein